MANRGEHISDEEFPIHDGFARAAPEDQPSPDVNYGAAGSDETDSNVAPLVPENASDEFSRRQFAKAAVVGSVALAEATSTVGGIVWFVRSRAAQGSKLQRVENRFVRFLKSQKTTGQVVADIPNLGAVINLGSLSDLLGVEVIDMDEVDASTSFTYLRGVKNDHGGIDDQPDAVSSVAAAGLKPEARKEVRMGKYTVKACAEPGAYSGEAFPGDKPYGLTSRKQMGNPDVVTFLRDGDAVKSIRLEAGFDDFKLLIATSPELVSTLADLTKFLSTDTLADEADQTLEGLKAQVMTIVRQFGQHMDEVFGTLAAISKIRVDRGQPGIFVKLVTCWDIGKQENMPANITTGELTPEALQYLVRDPAGPNRYFLRASSIPHGHDIGHWIWVALSTEQNAAERRAIKRYGKILNFVPLNLAYLNSENPDLYEDIDKDGILSRDGNGHLGRKGIIHAANADLELLTNTVGGEIITARSVADFSRYKKG